MLNKITETRKAMIALVGHDNPFSIAAISALPILDAGIVKSIVAIHCITLSDGMAVFPA
jgi:hypothetical protein